MSASAVSAHTRASYLTAGRRCGLLRLRVKYYTVSTRMNQNA